MKIKPWQVRSWMTSHDPEFDSKAVDVWGLYSVDEKTGIQAKSRINPTQPAVEGEPARQEFEYRRHGTTALFAAFECGTGEVTVRTTDSTKSVNFVSSLADLDAQVPAHLELHIILDHVSSHGTPLSRSSWTPIIECSCTAHSLTLPG